VFICGGGRGKKRGEIWNKEKKKNRKRKLSALIP
jgi:hypothetical protein